MRTPHGEPGGARRTGGLSLIAGGPSVTAPHGGRALQVQDIVRRRQLLTIFREGKDGQQDVDVAILQALLKGACPVTRGPGARDAESWSGRCVGQRAAGGWCWGARHQRRGAGSCITSFSR